MEIYGVLHILWATVAEKCWCDLSRCCGRLITGICSSAAFGLSVDFAASHSDGFGLISRCCK